MDIDLVFRLRKNTDLDELRDKTADRTDGNVLLKNLEKLLTRRMILMNQLRKQRTNHLTTVL